MSKKYISKILSAVLAIGAVFSLSVLNLSAFTASAEPFARQYIIYVGDGCPHCANVEAYVEKNDLEKFLPVIFKEIYYDRENAKEFNEVADRIGAPMNRRGVPFMVYGNQYWIGDKPIIEILENAYQNVKAEEEKDVQSPSESTKDNATQNNDNNEVAGNTTKSEKPNALKAAGVTLPILISAALVDSINPCEFAVLVILLSTILAGSGKRRALYSGLAFSAAIFLSYFAMGLGLYKAISVVGVSGIFMKVIASLAIVLGLFNLKDFFFYGKGFLMEVPTSWRPKMKAIIRGVTSPIGAFGIGFIISLFLLPCTSGPYIVILGMLGAEETFWSAVKYLLLYNIVFVLPMLIITLAVYKGFSTQKAEEIRQKRLKVLHLIAGLVLVVMGIVIFVMY